MAPGRAAGGKEKLNVMKNEIINYSLLDIEPDRVAIFETQGIGPGVKPSARVIKLYYSAVELFMKLAEPIGIIHEISIPEFARVYEGEGLNEADTPLQHIFEQASHLALFGATIGLQVSEKIAQLLEDGDLSMGYMLDSAASFCADKAAAAAEQFFLESLLQEGRAGDSTVVLNYSPGYCGWHISGQGKLFQYLKPQTIGITLNKSYLMMPIKSVSGVLVAGERKIHAFKNNYPFCKECGTKTCRERIKSLSVAVTKKN